MPGGPPAAQLAARQAVQRAGALRQAPGALNPTQGLPPTIPTATAFLAKGQIPPQFGRTQIMHLQNSLVKRGYHVTVDGIAGPQTKNAFADAAGNQNPSLWNQHSPFAIKVLDSHQSNTVRTPNNQPTLPNHGPGGPRDPAAARVKQQVGASPIGLKGTAALGTANTGVDPEQALINTLISNLRNPQIDPATYANASADAQYGPIIAGLQQQEADATAQGKQALADIAAEYGHLSGTLANNTAADAAQGAQASAAIGSLPAGLANALGLGDATTGAASAVAGLGSILSASQGMLNQAQASYDRNSQADAQIGGINALGAERNSTANTIKDLVSQISAQQSARGAFQTKTYADVNQQNATNSSNYANTVAGLVGQGANLRHQNLADAIAASNQALITDQFPLKNKILAAQLGQMISGAAYNNARAKAAIAKANATKTGFASLTPGQSGNLYGQLSKALHDPSLGIYKTDPTTGVATLADPARAVQMVQSMLGASFNLNDPKVQKWLMNFLRGQGLPTGGTVGPNVAALP